MKLLQFPILEGEEDQSQAGVQDRELVDERVEMREEQDMEEELAGEDKKDDEESLHLNISSDNEEGEGHDQADQAGALGQAGQAEGQTGAVEGTAYEDVTEDEDDRDQEEFMAIRMFQEEFECDYDIVMNIYSDDSDY